MFSGLLGFKAEKSEIQCRLALGRIKLQRNKKEIGLKQSRKDVAQLLRDGKQEYARIRVEGVIREQLMLSAFEILELFLELLAVRAQLIAKTKEIPRDMIEAISSIIYSANRVPDSPELVTLKKMLEQKYGGEYVKEASSDLGAPKWQVNANLLRCLLIEAPSGESKLACLSEIAQDHGIEWDASVAAKDLLPPPPPQPPPRSSQTLVANDALSFSPPINYPGNPATATAIKLPPPMVSLPPPPPQTQAQPYPTIQTPQMVPPPPPPPPPPGLVQYIDATTAAAAAQHAASQAKAAADFAAQFAMQSAGLAPPPQPQPTQRLPTFSHTPPAPPPPPPSTNEVQRAYDEALGPPTKEEKDDLPSAPPTPQSPRMEDDSDALPPSVPLTRVPLTRVPPPPSTQDEGGAFSFLPSPPRATVAPPQPEEEPDEYAVLAKRLEMLKKS